MAHALHPNYQERHDPALGPKMHGGMVLKHNANQRYATNAVTAFFFRELGARAGLPTQEFAVRADRQTDRRSAYRPRRAISSLTVK